MSKIVLIACGKTKRPYKSRAKDLYISNLFKKSLNYARLLKPDEIFILSAEYRLVDLEKELEPYDLTLNTMSALKIEQWAKGVKNQMDGKIDFENDEVTFLAGEKYREYLLPLFKKEPCIPMKGLKIGEQLQWLKKHGA